MTTNGGSSDKMNVELIGHPKTEEEFDNLLSDRTFIEYFNTFLSLPVFGKILTYNPKTDTFDTYPPLPRTRYHLPKSLVKGWVRQERLPFFWKTELFLEYLLCKQLCSTAVQSEASAVLEQLQTHLSTVQDMRRFHSFLRGSVGERVLLFWLDAERYRRHVKPRYRRFTFRDIQWRYLMSGSPRELPEIIKWTTLCGGNSHLDRKSSFKFSKSVFKHMHQADSSIFCENVFVVGQKMAIERLKTYWLPKYLEHKKYFAKLVNERRATLALLRKDEKPGVKRQIFPVPEHEQSVSPSEPDKYIDEFMEARCVSSTESVIDNEEETRARNLEEWKQWFWAGVDSEPGSEPIVEPPQDMPLQLRRLGGIQPAEIEDDIPAPPSTPSEPSVNLISVINTTMEEPEEREEETQLVPRNLFSTASFAHPPRALHRSKEERSFSLPAISNTEFVLKASKNEGTFDGTDGAGDEEDPEVIGIPKPQTPYALEPLTQKRTRTIFEALTERRDTIAEDENEELYDSSPASSSPARSTAESPLNTAAALERVSVHRVIPFEEIGNEAIAVVTKPRTLYPRETWHQHSSPSRTNIDLNMANKLLMVVADQLAGGPFREFLKKTKAKAALKSLEFWEDVQRYFASAEMDSFLRYRLAKTLITTYIAPGSPREITMSRRTRDDLMRSLLQERGDHLLSSLVKSVLEVAAESWVEYSRADRAHFIESVGVLKTNETRKRQTLEAGMVVEPILSGQNQTWRGLEVIIRLGLSGLAGYDEEENEEEEELEEECQIPSLKEKMRESFSRERRASHFYGQATRQNLEAVLEGNKRTPGGKTRPPRPRSFYEILHDSVQFVWFKRFLAEKNAEVPLLFWQAVENMKHNCKDGKARQGRTAVIVRKYFINIPSSADDYLHCKADIIRDIPLLPKTTPPMLVSAQACVARSMEEHWYVEYLRTFPENEGDGDNTGKYATRNTLAGVYKMAAHGKTRGLWAMFTQNVMNFQRGIHNRVILQAFKIFLKKESKITLEQNIRRHALNPSRRLINSKVVSMDRLISDIEFWLEVERFKELADNVAECAKSGNYTVEDENLLHDKARTIVKCFIDSDLPPRVQVWRKSPSPAVLIFSRMQRINAPIDLAEDIVSLVAGGIIERGLFHDAALSVFTPLMYFWKKFCADSQTELEALPHSGKRSNSRKRLMSVIAGIPYRKIFVPQEEESHWAYSLHQGLRLYLPLRFLVGRRVNQLGRQSLGPEMLTPQSMSRITNG